LQRVEEHAGQDNGFGATQWLDGAYDADERSGARSETEHGIEDFEFVGTQQNLHTQISGEEIGLMASEHRYAVMLDFGAPPGQRISFVNVSMDEAAGHAQGETQEEDLANGHNEYETVENDESVERQCQIQ
jgi:hypothetical protein